MSRPSAIVQCQAHGEKLHAANDEPSSEQITSAYLARSLNQAYGEPILSEAFFERADASQPSAAAREYRELMLQVDANRRDPLLREVY